MSRSVLISRQVFSHRRWAPSRSSRHKAGHRRPITRRVVGIHRSRRLCGEMSIRNVTRAANRLECADFSNNSSFSGCVFERIVLSVVFAECSQKTSRRDSERVGVPKSTSSKRQKSKIFPLTVLESAVSPPPCFSSVCVRLPLFSDFASAMSLEMSLAVKSGVDVKDPLAARLVHDTLDSPRCSAGANSPRWR